MKSFLDRFKRRDPDERAPETASELIGKAGAPADKPAIHVVSLETESKVPDPALASPPTGASPIATSVDNEVQLELGDFLHRIPQNLLRPGPHDVAMELRFDIAELSSLIARGQTSINLADLYARVPGIFRAEVRAEDNVEIRFPWQKLVNIVKTAGSSPVGKTGINQATADALAQKLRSRRPARNIRPGSSAKSQPATPQESGLGETGTLGMRGRQPAWVNNPASEKAPGGASAPSTDVEAPATSHTAALPPVGSPPPDTQGGVNQEELIRDRDAGNLEYTEAKADFQRQMAALREEREAIAAERDKAITELESAREELAAKIKELAERQVVTIAANTSAGVEQDALQQELERQQALQAKAASEVAEASAAREAVQKELAKKAAELEQLRNEIGALKKTTDERFAAISAERETLAREHDKVVADREAARKELAEKVAQSEAQQNVSTCGGEEAARLAAEREALKEELARKTGELEILKGQIAILGKKNDQNLAAIAQERDKARADLENARKELAESIHQLEEQQQLAFKGAEGSDEKAAGLTGEHARIAAELQCAREELAARDDKIAFQQELSAKSAEDAVKFVSERETLRKEVAAKTNDLESIKSDLTLLRQDAAKKYAAIAAERDKVLADLKRTREELAGKVEQIELQQSLVIKSGEDSAKADADREALRKELEARTGELDSLKRAFAALQESSDEKTAEFALGGDDAT
jgi:hypothetical protein